MLKRSHTLLLIDDLKKRDICFIRFNKSDKKKKKKISKTVRELEQKIEKLENNLDLTKVALDEEQLKCQQKIKKLEQLKKQAEFNQWVCKENEY